MTPIEAAVEASYRERVMKFITGPDSEPVQMFARPLRGTTGDWYGEHVGKWLCTAALAWHRTGDEVLKGRVEAVVDFLSQQQEPSGYLGTFAEHAECRFNHPRAHEGRTWDIWNHAWTIMGLTHVAEFMTNDQALETAKRAAHAIMSVAPAQVVRQGNHKGTSSAIIIPTRACGSMANASRSASRRRRRSRRPGMGGLAHFRLALPQQAQEHGLQNIFRIRGIACDAIRGAEDEPVVLLKDGSERAWSWGCALHVLFPR